MLPESRVFLFIISLFFLSSCETNENEATCANIQKIRASCNGPLTIGETFELYTQEVGGYRVYQWVGPNHFESQYPRNTITDVGLKHEGWYYVRVSNNSCETNGDSVYLDVKLKQGSPPCTVGANTCTFNNMFDNTYSSVTRSNNPTFGGLMLDAGIGGDLSVTFHDHWKGVEPEDGIYEAVDLPSFSSDGEYNKVFVSTVQSNVYFSCYERKNVYVSHVNGKLQVRFCDLPMSGSNGANSFRTLASANLIEN